MECEARILGLSGPRQTEVTTLQSLSYLALNGSLGTGFKEESLERGLKRPLAFLGADSGSTDGGPYYLGTGEWIWTTTAYERDMRLGLLGARRLGIPLIIGSCGGGGTDSAVDGYASMVERIGRASCRERVSYHV